MKVTIKNLGIFLVIFSMVLVVLSAIDVSSSARVSAGVGAKIRITVTDLDGNAVYNAQVSVCGKTFNTDNNGRSPMIDLPKVTNIYDSEITEWYAVNVKVTKDGFVPAFVFGVVAYDQSTRNLSVRIYRQDESELAYVSYVESPPDEYVKSLLSK